jgi:hypothetical protein
MMQSHLTGSDLSTLIPPLLGELLTWLGMVSVESDVFKVLPRSFFEAQNAKLMQHEDSLDVILPDAPRLRPLVMCCAWAEVQNHRLHVNAPAIRRALENGSDALPIASMLAELIGEPLSVVVDSTIPVTGEPANLAQQRILLTKYRITRGISSSHQ